MKPAQILLIGATLGSDNRGIGALAMGALAILAHQFPGCDIRFVDYNRVAATTLVQVNAREMSIPLVNLRFSKKFWLPNSIVRLLLLAALAGLSGPSRRARILGSNPWLKQLADADIAVAVSGGDSFSDIYGLARFVYMALPQLLIIMLGKPLVLLPQTIGPMRSLLAKRVARYIINHAQMSYSRDLDGVKATIDLLSLRTARNKLRFGYDMGFILEPRAPATGPALVNATDPTRPLVGLNVSGLLSTDPRYNSKFALRCDYQELVEEIVGLLIDDKQANVLLVPHVFGAAAESDMLAIETIYEKLKDRYPGQLFRLTQSYDQNEIKHVIGGCELFIGSRMHACIAALSQAVPAVGIAYSQKFSGVLSSIGVGHLVADPRQLAITEILHLIEDAFSERSAIRSQLMQTMPHVKDNVLNVLAGVV